MRQVYYIKYLGVMITKDGRGQKDLEYRTAKASSEFTRLSKIWKDIHVTIQTKISVHQVFIVSFFLYGAAREDRGKTDRQRRRPASKKN